MQKSYKFRIYPDTNQQQIITKTIGCCRFVYNHYLELHEQNKSIFDYNSANKDLTIFKKEHEFLSEVDSSALQYSLKYLSSAFKKEGTTPSFKAKNYCTKSYTTAFRNDNIKLLINKIQLPKLGLVKCKISKQIEGRIINATVSCSDCGEYYSSICCTDYEPEKFAPVSREITVTSDMQFVVDSIENDKLDRLQNKLDRKQENSKNRDKLIIQYKKQLQHIANQKEDYYQKLSTNLVRDYDKICIDESFPYNGLKTMIEYKSKWRK